MNKTPFNYVCPTPCFYVHFLYQKLCFRVWDFISLLYKWCTIMLLYYYWSFHCVLRASDVRQIRQFWPPTFTHPILFHYLIPAPSNYTCGIWWWIGQCDSGTLYCSERSRLCVTSIPPPSNTSGHTHCVTLESSIMRSAAMHVHHSTTHSIPRTVLLLDLLPLANAQATIVVVTGVFQTQS